MQVNVHWLALKTATRSVDTKAVMSSGSLREAPSTSFRSGACESRDQSASTRDLKGRRPWGPGLWKQYWVGGRVKVRAEVNRALVDQYLHPLGFNARDAIKIPFEHLHLDCADGDPHAVDAKAGDGTKIGPHAVHHRTVKAKVAVRKMFHFERPEQRFIAWNTRAASQREFYPRADACAVCRRRCFRIPS